MRVKTQARNDFTLNAHTHVYIHGARGDAFCLGPALQAERSRVRIQIITGIFIDIKLPATPRLWARLGL